MGDAVGAPDTSSTGEGLAPRRLAVLASGTGSNLQAVVDATVTGSLHGLATVAAVVSDRPDASALERARAAGVPAVPLAKLAGEQRRDYDARLVEAVAEFAPDLVVLAGWMRLLTTTFLDRFAGRVINLHPALPGELPGTKAIERAFDEFRAGRRTHTGVMVHVVPDEGVDDGPVVATVGVPIQPDDTLESLAARVHAAEHRLLVDAIATVLHPSRIPQPTSSRSR